MLIFAIVLLARLGTGAVLNPFGTNEVTAESENVHGINSIESNMELYLEEQSRDAVAHKKSSHGAQNWACPINESSDHPDPWNRYLNSLYCEFSKYEIQVAKKSFNVADIEDWGNFHVPNLEKRPIYETEEWKNNKGQGIKIDKSNFKKFLSKTGKYNIAEQDSIRNMKITALQLRELNHVLDLTLEEQMHIRCLEPYMFIEGNYIIFSHINLSISAGTVDDSCKELLNTDKLKYMNIFALNTIFIDDDMRSKMNLISAIAPKFEIIGNRKIDLNGEDGKAQESAVAANRHFFQGADGKPGNPGEPGGNFFGIGEKFINSENLIISANGGRGSAGQDGGNGTNGKDGDSPTLPSNYKCEEDALCTDGSKINMFECKQQKCDHHYTAAIYPAFPMYVFDGCTYTLYGRLGSPGGNAGNGGKGGEGGYPGDIVVFDLNGHSEVTNSNDFGSNGLDGKGGAGGVSGRKGNETDVKCQAFSLSREPWSIISTSFSNERATAGQNGTDGKNIRNMQERKAAIYISNADKAKVMNQYKSFLRTKMNDPFKKFFLVNFLNHLEKNQNVTNIYDTLGFVDELKSLEEHFHILNKDVNFLPFYGSLLDRISEYAQKVNNSNDKKVLGYLYTATLGRKHNLEDDLESNLITDVASYLQSVKNDIQKIKDLQNEEAKQDIINKYKQEYKTEIDIKIKDANDLISTEIIPQIKSIEKDIDNQIKELLNEVVQLQNQTITDNDELREKQMKLENLLVLQGFFSSLKILGQVVSFIGPVGAIAGSVIGTASSLAETYLLEDLSDSDSASENFEDRVSDLESLKEQINSFSEEKANKLKTTLDTVSDEVDKHSVLKEISVKVKAIRSRLTTIDQNKISIEDVQELEVEFKKTLKTEKEKIKEAEKDSEDEETLKAVAVIEHLQKAVELSSVAVEAYNKYQESQEKIDEIQRAIQKNEKKFDSLKQYEGKIYSSMVPMLENIENDLDDIISKIGNKDRVVLDVTKWKVQTTLKDLMIHMQKITLNFNIHEDIVRCIEKLQEAMVTLFNVQGFIQDYQKDQTLANFIAGISSDTGNGYLENNLKELEIIIRSSIVIQRQKVAIDAFKQFVFPFADAFFKGSLLPSNLELDTTNNTKLDNVISGAVIHIEQIKSKLEDYKVTVNKYDQCTGTGEFNGKSNKPFYVWINKKHKDMISKLLSGKEVIIKADIMSSPPHNDAIKFNAVEFFFKSKNKTIETEIKKVLKKFWIHATHMGDSYYRYDNQIYLMTTADISIWYYFKKKANGEPSQTSVSYDKIKNGDFMLSPYATWKIKLFNSTEKVSFKDLEIYKNAVNLALGGNGRYVIRGENPCLGLVVDKYYKPIISDNAEYRMDDLNEDDFVPLLEDDILTRSRREVNKELVTIIEERQITQHNQARSEHKDTKANSSSWLPWF